MSEMKTYTPEGYQALLDELDDIERRIEINKKDISTARSFGDLSENSEYDEAKEEQGRLHTRKLELKELIAHAKVLDSSQIDESKISVGSRVVVENLTRGGEYVYHIVGSYETDPKSGKISDESPIGRALLGASAGDKVTVTGCAREQVLVIKEVTRSKD